MAISAYIKEIGRGARGARALSREQAADLMAQLLDGHCSDLEIGAFCVAMRIKGETPVEMAGFLDAVQARMALQPAAERPIVVLPSYNGARKLPVLTPLLAWLLARQGLPVLMHGCATEAQRVCASEVHAALMDQGLDAIVSISNDAPQWIGTGALHPSLQKLLDVRRAIGLRNSAHSLVKLMNPVAGPALVVGSYTHPEYAESMAATIGLMGGHAMLLRGTEGEPVADARRAPRMEVFVNGQLQWTQAAQEGPLATLPQLPARIDAPSTADYIRAVLRGDLPVPKPIALQVQHIVQACDAIEATTADARAAARRAA